MRAHVWIWCNRYLLHTSSRIIYSGSLDISSETFFDIAVIHIMTSSTIDQSTRTLQRGVLKSARVPDIHGNSIEDLLFL